MMTQMTHNLPEIKFAIISRARLRFAQETCSLYSSLRNNRPRNL